MPCHQQSLVLQIMDSSTKENHFIFCFDWLFVLIPGIGVLVLSRQASSTLSPTKENLESAGPIHAFPTLVELASGWDEIDSYH